MSSQHGPITTVNMQLRGDQSTVGVAVHVVRGADRMALIDSGLIWGYDQLPAAMQEIGAGVADVDLLVNTHEHMDHIGNNARIVAESGCLVAAHPRFSSWIEDHQLGAERMVLRYPDVEPVFDPEPEYLAWMERESAPVHLHISAGAVLNLGGGVELEVFDFPGHSLSEIGFVERSSGTLIFGDALMPDDVPVLFLYEDPNHIRATCRRITALLEDREIQTVLSGHGAPCGREEAAVWAAACLERTHRIEEAVIDAVEQHPGADLGHLRDVVTARFGKLREWRALITIDGHLRDLESRGVVERTATGWTPGRSLAGAPR